MQFLTYQCEKAFINLTLMSSYAMAGVLCCSLLIKMFKTVPSERGCEYISTGASPDLSVVSSRNLLTLRLKDEQV